MTRRARCTWLLGVACLAALAGCKRSDRPRRERLTLYCGVTHEWCEAMAEAFEKGTGIHVSMRRKGYGEALASVRAERHNPRGDVWGAARATGTCAAAEAKLLEPYASPLLRELHPWAVDPEDNSSAWRWRARWCWNRRCCCSTSRSPTWTRSCADRAGDVQAGGGHGGAAAGAVVDLTRVVFPWPS